MTTPRPTAASPVPSTLPGAPSIPRAPDAVPGAGIGSVPDAPAPAGLPDLATLAGWANQLFATLPDRNGVGQAPVTALPDRNVLGQLPPTGLPGGGAASPIATPTAAATPSVTDVPSSLADIPTPPRAAPPVPAGMPSAVPPLHAGIPSAVPPVAVASSPYYFLGEAGPHPGPGAIPVRTDPAGFGFPTEAQLQSLLTVLPGTLATTPPDERTERYFVHSDPDHRAQDDAHPAFDVHAVRRDFPILAERVNGHRLVWFDNAATTQKPRAVIDRVSYFYEHENSNIHRGAHELAARATDAYEAARTTVARFLGASSAQEIVFVRGATEAINLVAQAWGPHNVHAGDEIVISHLEHHANIVPWQRLVAETGALLRVIPVDDSGQLILQEYQRLLSDRTKLVAFAQVSNALGTITPAQTVVDLGHRAGACVLVDGAQSVSHMPVDVQALDADFFVFSGHKIYGPTGIGALHGKAPVLAGMPPWQSGGNMIRDVTLQRSTYQDPPTRFEAGTANIADAVGLGAALDYVQTLGLPTIAAYEHDLLTYATHAMGQVSGLRLIGTAADKASVLSFVLAGHTPEQVGQALSGEGIAVRAGHHCAQPILRRFGLEATVRASLAFYNTTDEIDRMVTVLHQLVADAGRGRRSF